MHYQTASFCVLAERINRWNAAEVHERHDLFVLRKQQEIRTEEDAIRLGCCKQLQSALDLSGMSDLNCRDEHVQYASHALHCLEIHSVQRVSRVCEDANVRKLRKELLKQLQSFFLELGID